MSLKIAPAASDVIRDLWSRARHLLLAQLHNKQTIEGIQREQGTYTVT
jgi:hypothetical protein